MRDDLPLFLSVTGKVLRGTRRVVTIPVPAAGAAPTYNVDGGHQVMVLAGRGTLTIDAVAANRIPRLAYSDAVGVFFQTADFAAWALQGAHELDFAVGSTNVSNVAVGSVQALQIPPLWVPPGGSFSIVTSAMDPGDQWGAVRLYVEEVWFTNQDLHERELDERVEVETILGG